MTDPNKPSPVGLFRPFHIRRCPEDPPFLSRWRLLKLPGGRRVLLHRFHLSDRDRELHDHPWPFTSVVLAGGYSEETPEGVKWHPPGSILRRPAEWRHRVILPEGRKAWSLVFTGPRCRVWGFWTDRGWVDWVTFGKGLQCDENGRSVTP